ncbi:PolC-type DNA polymerase III [Cohnella sp. CFH 77786]|uniref:PolC-type DNA polymerase III n=1 Tax=Cohnella sp. CFH 77786 TaxID=2662265 RepID=UPI001C610281|nr:PolC-type DNA polymerase III [Cohnella sp. CFH 77786]MBW5444535.1 PolC-type DNA polymerase III [Cohnella sp. CFH 77786]
MHQAADGRKRFELLLQQAEIPAAWVSEYFSDGYIDKVEVSKARKEWKFHIVKSTPLPASIYIGWIEKMKAKLGHLADIVVRLAYEDAVPTSTVLEEYWPVFVEWMQREFVSVNGWLAKARIEAENGLLTLYLLDEMSLGLAQRKSVDAHAVRFFEDRFGRSCRVKLAVGESRQEVYDEFQQKIREENGQAVQQLMATVQTEAPPAGDAPEVLQHGYEIKDEPVPIQQVQEEEKKVTVQGTVFGLEVKELRTGSTLYQFNVTDFTDSIGVKVFGKTKDDNKVLGLLANGKWLKLRGRVEYDRFMNPPELVMMPSDLKEVSAPPEPKDEAEEKRVEFHLHTTMSAMDAVTPVDAYIKTAAKWGHKAIAITDHSNVQCYPDAVKAGKKHGMKVLFGVEANVVNDAVPMVLNPREESLPDATYVVFDIETTGLSVTANKIIELAGVKMKDGQEIGRFETFINPHEPIPYNIQQLTGIGDEMVKDAPELAPKLREFLEFVQDSVLVAHNARFDIGFIQEACKQHGFPPVANSVLDTLELARFLHPTMKNHRLNTLADLYKVSLENHHRAIDDTIALGGILNGLIKDAQTRGVAELHQLNEVNVNGWKTTRPFHCGIYALNAVGKKNLFKLISLSHTDFFNRVACIPRSKLVELREGLLVMSGCEKGEFFETVLNKSLEEAEDVAAFYDVLEIQPLDFYMHLLDKGLVGSRAELEEALRKICRIGEKLGKPVVATGNVHYLTPREKLFRDVTIHGITGFSPLKDQRKPDAHFRTTNEMLECFAFLGKEKAYEVVVRNTSELADRFEPFEMFPKKGGPTDNGLFSPIIDGADEEIRNKCYETARRMYGDPIPEIVTARLEKELKPIIQYGFSANYLISERLVKKSNADGYLVGSRGSVGSSVVAMFLGISEVNPLPAHYLCRNPSCKRSEFITDGSVPSGFDLKDKPCPDCGNVMKGDGQDIPFETFLGFKGDKVPDIDLNFSGEYQPHAHNYTKVLFGEKSVFRAGTIGTVAEKTGFGYAKKYQEDHGKSWRGAELNRIALGVTGVKRSSGQHPGGIVVVPDYIEVEDITPVQYPADDTSSEWKTTHFDYHAFDENLLKLDILGHDDPTMMRMLQDLTGVDPTTIPMNDPKVMSLFNSVVALGVTPEQIRTPVATYGVPEMGTRFVRQMLEETKPSSFADLLQISGLSHGTGVWLGNAQELIKNGTCTIKTVIGCRDDIMLFLIYKGGMDASLAFKITESVRKGKGLTPEWIDEMKRSGVPQWYIDSCLKIEYMFPKAHASAYVISAVRTAYFKLYYPIEFYATYFSVRAADFDVELFCQGYDAILKTLVDIENKGFQATTKEKNMISILEMGLEMTARGFKVKPLDLYRSDATRFIVDGDSLIPPFSAVAGIGENAARNIAASRADGDFLSIEDFQQRSKASKTIVELLNGMGCFRGLPESNQLMLF